MGLLRRTLEYVICRGRLYVEGYCWGAPMLIVRLLDVIFFILTCCLLSVRKFVIQSQVEADK